MTEKEKRLLEFRSKLEGHIATIDFLLKNPDLPHEVVVGTADKVISDMEEYSRLLEEEEKW